MNDVISTDLNISFTFGSNQSIGGKTVTVTDIAPEPQYDSFYVTSTDSTLTFFKFT